MKAATDTASAAAQPQPAAATAEKRPPAQDLLDHPASEVRILLPVLLFAVVAALAYLVMVLVPIGGVVSGEPDPIIQAVLANFRLMLNIRFWPVLLGAGLLAAGAAVLTARRIAKAHDRLEKRLRRLASGEYDDSNFSANAEFPQFQEVLLTLHYAQEQARKKGRSTILQAEGTIDKIVRRLINEDVPKMEIQKALAGIQTELNTLLEQPRHLGGGKQKQ